MSQKVASGVEIGDFGGATQANQTLPKNSGNAIVTHVFTFHNLPGSDL